MLKKNKLNTVSSQSFLNELGINTAQFYGVPFLHWRGLLSETLIGSLSKNDGNGYENVILKKVNSRCLKLYRAYSISFHMWTNFFGVDF